MDNPSPQHEIRNEVLAQIRRGDIRMRPRAYFALRAAAVLIVALGALLLSAFLLSFILFSLHESGEQLLLGFGLQGFLVFMRLFPWIAFVLDLALIFLLEWLLQGFSIGYRIPLLTIFIALFGAAVILAIVFNLTPLHYLILDRADHGQLPFIGEAYEQIYESHEDQGIFRGTITAMGPSGFNLNCNDNDRDKDDGTFIVALTPDTHIPLPPPLNVGDHVYIFGTTTAPGRISAYGVERFNPQYR